MLWNLAKQLLGFVFIASFTLGVLGMLALTLLPR